MLEREIVKNLPDLPGVYFYIGVSGDIIYVGKAKSIKKRLTSYFINASKDIKIAELLRCSIMIKYYITRNEKEAYIIEDKLIKKLKPRYNVLQKDAKTFPFVKITGEAFPRVILTRKIEKDKGRYFGPYPEVASLKQFLRNYADFLVIRKCKRKLPGKKKYEPCLYYHIGQCPAPCAGLITPEGYKKIVSKVADFLSGGKRDYAEEIERRMKAAAAAKNYEAAKRFRDILSCIRVNFDRIRLRKISDKDLEDILKLTVSAYDEKAESLMRALKMDRPPYKIEGFDISNLGEEYAVGSMVVFFNGTPLKSEYRRYRIKTVAGQNDFEMLREIVTRCYKRRLEEGRKMPDLILIDGGPVQVKFARSALEEMKIKNVTLIGLAKKEETVITIDGSPADVGPEPLKILQQVRDEAHRFARAYHIKLRR